MYQQLFNSFYFNLFKNTHLVEMFTIVGFFKWFSTDWFVPGIQALLCKNRVEFNFLCLCVCNKTVNMLRMYLLLEALPVAGLFLEDSFQLRCDPEGLEKVRIFSDLGRVTRVCLELFMTLLHCRLLSNNLLYVLLHWTSQYMLFQHQREI